MSQYQIAFCIPVGDPTLLEIFPNCRCKSLPFHVAGRHDILFVFSLPDLLHDPIRHTSFPVAQNIKLVPLFMQSASKDQQQNLYFPDHLAVLLIALD
ncbi:hypothetical protein D3C84_459140 [compost metagenome]